MTYKYKIDGIDCAACAKELEEEISEIDGVSQCTLTFGVHSHLSYEYAGEDAAKAEAQMRQIH